MSSGLVKNIYASVNELSSFSVSLTVILSTAAFSAFVSLYSTIHAFGVVIVSILDLLSKSSICLHKSSCYPFE